MLLARNMEEEVISFRWTYIVLPLAILLLSAILVAWFYHLLPGEVAYHFKNGSPDRWMSRGLFVAWTLTPQFFFVLMAAGVVWGVTKLSALSRQTGNPLVKPGKLLSVMGNMLVLPQIIISFAMLDVFLYNSYQVHLIPLWAFALIVMGSGVIVMGVLFILAARRAWRVSGARGGRSFKEQS